MSKKHFVVLAATMAALVLFQGSAAAHVDVIMPYCDAAADDAGLAYDSGGCYNWYVSPSYQGPYYVDSASADAAEPPPPAPVTPSLPTWRNLYDWPNGHGYVGWHTASSGQAGAYGMQPNLGGNYGLWLWPVGGTSYSYSQGQYAEWTYTAPGTTRLASATLILSYRNKLLAHHCLDVGFRDGSGAIVTHNEHCTPVKPPDSQRQVTISLVDPATNPTSKVLYFRIRVDCGGAGTCSKNIPQLDPLSTGAYARLQKVDMTLVDDDVPVVTPSGLLWDLRYDSTTGGVFQVTATATDAGSGINRVWLEREGAGTIASADAPCDPAHNTPSLDARICPDSASLTTSVDLGALPDGTYWFVAKASDPAGNVGASEEWPVTVKRTPAEDDYGPSQPDDGVEPPGTDEYPGGGADAYDPATDPDNACDAYTDLGIADECLDPTATTDPASGITGTGAVLNGHIEPHGNAATYYFEWQGGGSVGTTPERTIDEVPDATVTESETLAGLAASTDYSFRLVAHEDGGALVAGAWQTFRTSSDCGASPCGTTSAPIVVASSNSASSSSTALAAPTAAADATAPSSYSGCGLEAVFWATRGVTNLVAGLKQWNIGVLCGNYYFAQEQGPSEKLEPACFPGTRASWPVNFHAAPVFHWSSWSDWIKASPGTRSWYQAGLLFRQKMEANGCLAGDRWFVNELPSSWRSAGVSADTRRRVRARILNALRGLYYGGAASDVKGYTADVVLSHAQTSLGVYKSALEQAYGAANFWRLVRVYVDGWTKEVYNRCTQICVRETARTIADQGVNNYSYHQRFLAIAAPDAYAPAKTTLAQTHAPLLNAVWRSPLPVFDSLISLPQMIRVIRQQVYSARRAAEFGYGSGGRIGFAWKDSGFNTDDDAAKAKQMAANLALALRNAYRDDNPGAACVDNDGTRNYYFGCPPAPRSGAAFNTAWNIFKTW
jgi:hypothetical protein